MTTGSTNSPSEAAHGTARLPNPSTTLSKEVEEVARELKLTATGNPLSRYCDQRAADVNLLRKAADFLTRISAERDRLEDRVVELTSKCGAACGAADTLRDVVASYQREVGEERARADRAEADLVAYRSRAEAAEGALRNIAIDTHTGVIFRQLASPELMTLVRRARALNTESGS